MSVSPLPGKGGVHFDRRDAGRSLRVSAHPETGTVVVTMWRDDYCVASHHLAAPDVPDLIRMLATALVPEPGSGHRLAC